MSNSIAKNFKFFSLKYIFLFITKHLLTIGLLYSLLYLLDKILQGVICMSNSIAKNFKFFSLLRFALPTMVMMIFMSLYSIVDGIFISRLLGTDALSASNIVYPVISIVFAVGIMLSTGGSALIAQYCISCYQYCFRSRHYAFYGRQRLNCKKIRRRKRPGSTGRLFFLNSYKLPFWYRHPACW